MLNVYELPHNAKCKVWIDEWPDAHLGEVELPCFSVPTAGRQRSESSDIAVEWWAPTGPRVLYGLLGGSFEANGAGLLKVCRKDGAVGGAYKTDFPVVYGERIFVGLPAEFVEAALEGIRIACALSSETPPGQITLKVAAHGIVGSSPHVFHFLGRVIGKAWCMPSVPRSQVIVDLVRDEVI